jgi:hypothetical protein
VSEGGAAGSVTQITLRSLASSTKEVEERKKEFFLGICPTSPAHGCSDWDSK